MAKAISIFALALTNYTKIMKEDIYFADESVYNSLKKAIIQENTFTRGGMRYYVSLFDKSKCPDSRNFIATFHTLGIFNLYIASESYHKALVRDFTSAVDTIIAKYKEIRENLLQFLDQIDNKYDLDYMKPTEAAELLVREYVKGTNICKVSDINSNLEAFVLSYVFLSLNADRYIQIEDYYVDRQINCGYYMTKLLSKELGIVRKLRHRLVRSRYGTFRNVIFINYHRVGYQISIYGDDDKKSEPVKLKFKDDFYKDGFYVRSNSGEFGNWPDIYIDSYYSKKNLDLIIEKIKIIDALYSSYKKKWSRKELNALIDKLIDFIEPNERYFLDEVMYPWFVGQTFAEEYFKHIGVEVEDPELHILALSIVIADEFDRRFDRMNRRYRNKH